MFEYGLLSLSIFALLRGNIRVDVGLSGSAV